MSAQQPSKVYIVVETDLADKKTEPDKHDGPSRIVGVHAAGEDAESELESLRLSLTKDWRGAKRSVDTEHGNNDNDSPITTLHFYENENYKHSVRLEVETKDLHGGTVTIAPKRADKSLDNKKKTRSTKSQANKAATRTDSVKADPKSGSHGDVNDPHEMNLTNMITVDPEDEEGDSDAENGGSISGHSSALEGRNIVFTGALPTMTRKEAQALIERHGATFQNSTNKETDLVVLGQRPGNVKLAKIEEMGIETASLDDLYDMIRKGSSEGGTGRNKRDGPNKDSSEPKRIKK